MHFNNQVLLMRDIFLAECNSHLRASVSAVAGVIYIQNPPYFANHTLVDKRGSERYYNVAVRLIQTEHELVSGRIESDSERRGEQTTTRIMKGVCGGPNENNRTQCISSRRTALMQACRVTNMQLLSIS